jgi:hypothetical protein
MNAPRQDWGAPEPGCAGCGCGGGCGDGPPHMPRGAWSQDDDDLGGLQPPKRAGPVPDWDPDEQDGEDLITAKARAAAHFGAWALATDPDVIDLELPNVSMDIYFSAGPSDRSSPFGCSSRVMSQHNDKGICSLYRVRLRAAPRPSKASPWVEVTSILLARRGNVDRFQPVVSPDGRSLAYTTRHTDPRFSPSKMKSEHSIDVYDLENHHTEMVSASGYSGGGHQFPMWRTSQRLAWTIGDEVSSDAKSSRDSIGSAVVQNDGGSFRVRGEVALLGPKAGITSRTTLDTGVEASNVDFADSDQQPAAAEPNDGGRNVVMHSKDFTSKDEEDKKEYGAAPIVVKLTGNVNSVRYERVVLGTRDQQVEECHHPAWSPFNEIMCHGGVLIDATNWQGSLVYDKRSLKSTVWYPLGSSDVLAAPVDAFPLPSLSSLLKTLRLAYHFAFGVNGSIQEPRAVAFKYSRFTPDRNYIVSTVTVSGQIDFGKPTPSNVRANPTSTPADNDGPFAFSRVVLIHRLTGKIWDLTTLVESYEGAKKGQYGAFAPSCADVRS